MNFVDFVTLMLMNMVGGLLVLASFLWHDVDLEPQNNHRWAPAMAIPGLVAAVCGFAMTFSWPLPSPYNIAFGETSIMLGMLLLGAAWSLSKGWNLLPLGIYAFVAGLVAILIGIRVADAGLTSNPPLTAAGFILTGSGGVFAGPILHFRQFFVLRRIGSVALFVAAIIWSYTGLMAYWVHLQPKPQ